MTHLNRKHSKTDQFEKLRLSANTTWTLGITFSVAILSLIAAVILKDTHIGSFDANPLAAFYSGAAFVFTLATIIVLMVAARTRRKVTLSRKADMMKENKRRALEARGQYKVDEGPYSHPPF